MGVQGRLLSGRGTAVSGLLPHVPLPETCVDLSTKGRVCPEVITASRCWLGL